MTLTTAYSPWLIPLCLALGAFCAWLLYRGSRERSGWNSPLVWTLGIFRAVVIATLAFLLLEPMVRILLRDVRKPIVVVAHDGSSSLLAGKDSAFYRGEYLQRLEGLRDGLNDRFDPRPLTYGDEVVDGLKGEGTDGHTDIDQLFRNVHDRFAGPDLGAVIIDGDGIYNRGRDPLLAAEKLGVPVFVVALGDTTVRPDLVLRDVEHNRITYLGNEFPVLARVVAHHLKGARSRVIISRDGKELAAAEVQVGTDPAIIEVPLLVKADVAGTQRYTVAVKDVSGEVSTTNNGQTIYVDVLDDRRKVLVLALSPHPDVAALRESINGMEGYACDVAYAANFQGKPEDYDLVVLHQLPSGYAAVQPVLQRIIEKHVPTWTIIGQNTDFNQLNALGGGAEITSAQRTVNDAQAAMSPDFALFTLDADVVQAIERFPPLQVPIATYQTRRGASALLLQKVGVVRTPYPLFVIQPQGERHDAMTCGEGLWRWRLADQQLFRTHAHFDQLVQKIVTYLALKQDKSRFRVHHAPEFDENEHVVIDADLYNASYEPVNASEASISLQNEKGEELVFAFGRSGANYRVDAGALPAGRYTWRASTELDGERLQTKGELLVRPLLAERASLVADHQLWNAIAARTGGLVVPADSLDRILGALEERPALAARSYSHASFSDLIGLRWIFFVLLSFLAVEWALRRRSGSY